MRTLLTALAVAVVLALPSTGQAGWIVEVSVGKGLRASPSPVEAEQTNIMIAPGFTIPFFRFELGLVNDLPDVKDSKYNLQLRPMIVLAPPILPLYARAIFAVTNLINGDTTVAYGAAGGIKIGLGLVGIFAEVGALPRSRNSEINWVIEGRAGAYLSF